MSEKKRSVGSKRRLGGFRDGMRRDAAELRSGMNEIRDELREDARGIREGFADAKAEVEGDIERASVAVVRLEDSFVEAAEQNKAFPKTMKAFAVLLVLTGVFHFLGCSAVIALAAEAVREGGVSQLASSIDFQTMMGVALSALLVLIVTASSAISVLLGLRLLGDRRTKAARYAKVLMLIEFGALSVSLMLYGVSSGAFISLAYASFLGLLSVYADPRLRRERVARRRVRRLEEKQDQEDGVLGLDKTGKGYIELDFFNLFWIFVVCCFFGLLIETVYHMTVIDFGAYQDRAGLLYGPFSPIYGVGGVLITIALNRFHKSNPMAVFLAAAFIGSAFEFLVSWWMEMSFGITAWDYTGTFLNIDGRTNFRFFCMWGCLGIVWLRFVLPRLLTLINRIPWNWRYSATVACAALMIADCGLTVASLDRWYERQEAGGQAVSESALEAFCDEHYDDHFMAERFQTMSIDADASGRVS